MTGKKSDDMTKKIMQDVKNNEIQMHSKTYFRFLTLALIAMSGMFLILTSITALVVIRDIGYGISLDLGEFGSIGRTEFFKTIPWLAIVFGLTALLITLTLIRRFEFSYKYRLFVIFGILLFSIAGLSIIFSSSGFEERFSRTDPIREFRSFEQYSNDHILACEVESINQDNLEVIGPTKQKITVYLKGLFADGYNEYSTGDEVYLFGKYVGNDFEAYGVRKVAPPTPPYSEEK